MLSCALRLSLFLFLLSRNNNLWLFGSLDNAVTIKYLYHFDFILGWNKLKLKPKIFFGTHTNSFLPIWLYNLESSWSAWFPWLDFTRRWIVSPSCEETVRMEVDHGLFVLPGLALINYSTGHNTCFFLYLSCLACGYLNITLTCDLKHVSNIYFPLQLLLYSLSTTG